MGSILEQAAGQWPRLLAELGGLSAEQLTDRHQPCPACGGTDRYRWDRDDGPGGCFCNQCGGKDHQGGAMSGVDLLMRVRSWSLQDACAAVERHLGLAAPIPEPPTAGAEHVWRYTETFIVTRFPGKRIRPLWWDGSAWRWKAPPSPRPLYWARRAVGAPVLIAEGEKAADAAALLLTSYAVCTWASGCKAIDKADWQPLRGRDVVLWPDADAVGREAMAKLAARLLALDCTVRVVAVPADLPEGWDLADALADGWTSGRAVKAIERLGRVVERPAAPEPPAAPPAEPAAAPAEPLPSAPFTCLGFDDGGYFYQPNNTGQVIRIGRASHTAVNLLALAPVAYWETLFPSKSGPSWTTAASSLFQQQARVGIYSPDRIRGRGAWWDDGRPVLHLGDRLLVNGTLHPITNQPPSRFNYQRLASIDLPTDIEPLTDQQGAEILDIASRFLWEVPASGLLLAGWAALAPICGSLAWRPHVWLTASAGSGKSAILERFLGTLLQDIALWPEGSTTESAIRQELRADAKPVIMDEAESNEVADRKRIQDILALARVASSSSTRGFVGRGGADGVAQRYTARAMFLLCSISTALKQGADSSRFAQLTLRNPKVLSPEQRRAHWEGLDRDMTALITPDVGHRMLLRSVQLIPVIRDSVAVFRRAAALHFDSQRQGDQYGTLLAGAWSLMNARVATEADARGLIEGNDWAAYKESAEQADEDRCLQHILQHQLRVEVERTEISAGKVFSRNATITRTVWELVEAIRGNAEPADVPADAAEAHLGRIGIRVMDGRLVIANTALGLQKILASTAWAHSWPTVLSRIPGSTKPGKVRFKGMADSSRAVSLPLERD
jgi:putative DNA primase/helicase